MEINVSLFANLRSYAPAGKGNFDIGLAAGATVADLVSALGIPRVVEAVILVNGRRADLGTPLNAEDTVTLFPPMEGG